MIILLQLLSDWHQQAVDDLNKQYEEWKKNSPELLEVSPTSSSDSLSNNRLYTTDDSSNSLLDIVIKLASSTRNTSDTIASNGNAIGSMDTQFNTLAEQAKRVQGEVKEGRLLRIRPKILKIVLSLIRTFKEYYQMLVQTEQITKLF